VFCCHPPDTKGSQTFVGGVRLEEGVFAVVESAKVDDAGLGEFKSTVAKPYYKEVDLDKDGNVKNKKLFLANTEAFLKPVCAVPDIGGPPNRYFVVQPRDEWHNNFIRWLGEKDDEMEEIVPPPPKDKKKKAKKRKRTKLEENEEEGDSDGVAVDVDEDGDSDDKANGEEGEGE
jgi:hypothetical protein